MEQGILNLGQGLNQNKGFEVKSEFGTLVLSVITSFFFFFNIGHTI